MSTPCRRPQEAAARKNGSLPAGDLCRDFGRTATGGFVLLGAPLLVTAASKEGDVQIAALDKAAGALVAADPDNPSFVEQSDVEEDTDIPRFHLERPRSRARDFRDTVIGDATSPKTDVQFRWIKRDGEAYRMQMRVPKSDGGGMKEGGTFSRREDAVDAAKGPNFLISEAGGRPSSHGTSETGQLLLPASKPARRGSLAWFVLLLWKRLLDENTLSDADVAALDEMMWYSGRELSQNIRLPGSLQSLTFGYVFNQSLEDIQLPSSLQRLTFGYAFDQRLRASNYRARFDVWLCVQPAFNWGYDPVLYGVPEGSYSSDPDGMARVLEHRRMVAGLHKKGLRVIADVVFNHVFGSGPKGNHSVLDKCVPGYYLRRSEDGRVENSTCMNNTATERYMMERLVVDMIRHWAIEHRMDGFRFDLMGHITLECIQKCRAALDELSVEEHGIDGPRLLLYGEGWEFGEIEGGARGATACQRQLAGTGIGSFNDNLRGAVLGGNAFEDPRLQGFATGLGLREPSDVALKTTTSELELLVAFGRDIWREDPHTPGIYEYKDTKDYRGQDLRIAADILRVCLAAGLRQFRLEQDCLGKRNVLASQVHGGKAAYVSSPEEVVNFICVHDNETLYDSTIWKMSPETTDPEERMRANWLCSATLALGHGVPLFHAGDEVLRSKSLDRDSYNSGDWFNLLDYSGETSAFGAGLPPWGKNHTKWELMKPLLRDDRLRPNKEMVAATTAKFCELLGIRKSTALLGLREAADIVDKVHFPGCGLGQIPGVVVMEVRNGTSSASGTPLCDKYSRVVVVFSARPDEVRIPAPTSRSGGMLMLHPLQVASADTRTREARYDEATDELVVPALTAAVFVEPQPNQPSFKASERRAQFRPALRERPIVGDGMGLVAADPACVPFKGHFEYRWKVYTDLRKHISETSGSLTEFASGFRKLGFTKDEASGAITYREWLPPAKAVSLVGDFNNWDEGATPLARDAFGTWEVTLPAKSIAHRTKVKFCATTPDGSKVYRVPAWIRWSCPDLGKFGSTYDGYYWDPSEDVLSPDELAIVVQNYRDGGLNAQPETPEKEEAPRKKGSLLEWEHPSKVGLINRRSLMLNWKVTRFFEEIEVTPKNGLVHCTSHSLKMFVSYINRRHDGSVRKDHRLKAIFDEVAKSWPPKIRSRKTLVVAEEDGEIEDEQEEEEEEEQQLTEDDEEDGQPAEVDGYLAQSLGIVPGSPAPPASAYVATVAYELSDEGPPVPYAAALPNGDDDTDLVRQLAELEQQIAHRRAALSGRQAIERWHSLQHMDSQRTIAWPETLQEFVAEQPAPLSSATEGGYFRQGASSNLSLGHVEAKDVAPCNVPVATPARAASVAPAVSEDLADPTDVAVAPGVSEDLADPTKAAVAPGVSEDLADKAAVAPGVSEDLADKAPVAPGVSEDLAEPAVAPGVSQDLADPAQLAVAPGVLKDLADRAVAPGVLKDLADPVAPRVSDDLGEATPATPRPESVSLEIASSSQPPSPELLALKVQTRRAEQMRGREGGTQEDVPVFKRPAAKGWPKGKAKARPAKGELLDDEPTKRAKKGQQGDDEPKKRATKGEQGDDEPKPKRATKGEQQGDEPKPKRAKKGEQGDEPKPKRAKKGEQQGEEEPKPKRAKKGKQGDDEPKRAKKGEQQGDDEPKRAKKGKQGDEPKRAQKGKQGDEPKRAQKGKQGDEEPKPKPAKKGKQGDEPKPLKKTFAKRWEPEVEGRSKCLWTSIRDAFNDLIRPQLRFPTKFEDCQPKSIPPTLKP
ncbi:PU1 [Symbiodinium sp. KB8]|nr:PU1 [Symbiodinium sp. KB8]